MKMIFEDVLISIIGGLVLAVIIAFNIYSGMEVAGIILLVGWFMALTIVMDYMTAKRHKRAAKEKLAKYRNDIKRA